MRSTVGGERLSDKVQFHGRPLGQFWRRPPSRSRSASSPEESGTGRARGRTRWTVGARDSAAGVPRAVGRPADRPQHRGGGVRPADRRGLADSPPWVGHAGGRACAADVQPAKVRGSTEPIDPIEPRLALRPPPRSSGSGGVSQGRLAGGPAASARRRSTRSVGLRPGWAGRCADHTGRVGWLVLPDALVDEVVAAKSCIDPGSNVLDVLTVAELIDSGDYDRIVRRRRSSYRRRRDRLVEVVSEHAPGSTITGIAAGLHVLAGAADRDGGGTGDRLGGLARFASRGSRRLCRRTTSARRQSWSATPAARARPDRRTGPIAAALTDQRTPSVR